MSARCYDHKLISDQSVIIDVGSHDGTETLECYNLHQCRILAFEASRRLYSRLVEKCTGTRVEPVNAALAGFNGQTTFYEFEYPAPFSGEGNSIYPRHLTEMKKLGASYQISCLTIGGMLDACHASSADLLFLDCEGAEHEAINEIAGSEALRSRLSQVCIEFHPQIYGNNTHKTLAAKMAEYYDIFFDDGIKNTTYVARMPPTRNIAGKPG